MLQIEQLFGVRSACIDELLLGASRVADVNLACSLLDGSLLQHMHMRNSWLTSC